ncbi:adenosylcobinamide-GDP ribazoletransferase [Prolixibacteraceae bacterium JC049]|nr:adenosylcobinamide-GDP ribazoletransferase [Prolixibacteraceae bacterium JC049]
MRIIKNFFTAITFFTRIPVARWADYSQNAMNQATAYYPMVGWIVGGFAALICWLMGMVIPVVPAVVISTVASIWLTGAFHEDGFADVCDGFGGGWEKERILTIMKDSRVGAYGAIGILLILMTKITLLSEIQLRLIPVVLIAGHTLSRMVSVSSMMVLGYVRENDADGKSKPIARKLPPSVFLWILISGSVPLVLLGSWKYAAIFLPQLILLYLMNRWFKKWIGGYTGDCLGALQQVSEVVFYLSVLIIEKNWI